MADVLLARTGGLEGFERHVVIKRIRHELAHDRRFVRMFLDEARVAATLHHQNIVQVHDVGEVDGEYFIAMEYVHGEDVRRLLEHASRQRSHVPLGYIAAIVSAAASGLHHAHERLGNDRRPLHIVHRDVSPSNILIGYDGAIKLVDFGIATASLQRESRAASLTGKLAYMSPEQCLGGPVDRRTDVYGLGVVLYELVTTMPMIQGDSDRQVIEKVVQGRITPPHTRRPDLPRELSDIILRALATDPAQRYDSAEQLRVALDQFAWNAGLTAPASSLAAYLRQQFGERPEPWLELDDAAADDFEEISVSHVAPMPAASDWDEVPGATDPHHHAGAVSHRRDPIALIPGNPDAAGRTAGQREPGPSRSRWRALALIGPAACALVAATIWFAASLPSPNAPAVVPAPGPAHAPVAPAPAAAPPPAVPEPAPVAVAAAPALPADAGADSADGADGADNAPTAHGKRPAAAPGRRTASSGDDAATARSRPVRVATVAPRGEAARSKPERGERIDRGERDAPAADLPAPSEPAASDPPRPVAPPPAPAPDAAPPRPQTPVVAAAPPARAVAPQVIAPASLEANRIAGDKTIAPDRITQDAITRAGSEEVVSTYKICVAVDGQVNLVTQMRSSGFAAYDEKIRSTIRTTWRYRPFVIGGQPTPVCTALRFVYAQN